MTRQYEIKFSHGADYRVGIEMAEGVVSVDWPLDHPEGRMKVEQMLAAKGYRNPWIYRWTPVQPADQEK